MCDHWGQFKRALQRSIVNIDQRYFQIDRQDDQSAWRERVYCYELYHQLRHQLGDVFPYTLHGEIDKRGHDAISQFFDNGPNPDFVVHIPGTPNNLVVIEVKSSSQANADNAQKDLGKLQTFVEKVRYGHGIFLIFGPRRVLVPDPRNNKIVVLHHKKVGQVPEILYGQEEW